MQPRFNWFWMLLTLVVTGFCLLYIFYVLFPGSAGSDVLKHFSSEQVTQAREYARFLRLVSIMAFMVQVGFMLWFVFSGKAGLFDSFCRKIAGGNYWAGLLLFISLFWLGLKLLALPFTFLSSYYWQHRWGFSTQTLPAWWLDYAKSAGLDLLLFLAGALILFWLMNKFIRSWWLWTSLLLAGWLFFQMLIWPVLVSPLFNRFEPVNDPGLLHMVQSLSQKAGLEVDQVLIMDASRRTTQANAYFTGIGGTKRIVLYDTLINNYPSEEVEAVVAHEMGHWSKGHVLQGLVWGAAANFLLWALLYGVIGRALPSSRPIPAAYLAVIMLFFTMILFAGSPLENSISRGMEEEADRVAVQLTGDKEAAVKLEVNLAVKNLSDVAPAPFIRWFGYSHPPAPERITIIEQALK